jgi:hypothetical protein
VGPNAGREEDGPRIGGVIVIEVYGEVAIHAFDAFDLHPETKFNASPLRYSFVSGGRL